MNTYTRKTLLASMVALFAAGGASGSLAQGGEAATEQGRIDEIIVTATKREESLQDVPISMSVVTDSIIKNQGAKNLQEVISVMPNVIFPEGASSEWNPTIAIRGAYTPQQFLGMEISTGVYVDGVFMGKNDAFNPSTNDLERVEVLRGPQGTLFGKNTTGGAISLVTKKPSNEFEGDVNIELGNYDLVNGSGALNLPLIDNTLAARISINHAERDGYADNLTTGSDLGIIDKTSWRAQLLYTPTENTEVRFIVDGSDSKANYMAGETLVPIGDDKPYTIFNTIDPVVEKEGEGIALIVDHEFNNGHTLTSITSRREADVGIHRDFDATPADALDQLYDSAQENVSQEIRLASPTGRSFDYVAGLYYFDQDFSISEFFDVGPDLAGPSLAGDRIVGTDHKIDSTSYAAFVHSNFHLSDNTTAFAGLRYTKEDQSIVSQAAGRADWVGILSLDLATRNLELDPESVSGIIGIRHRISEGAVVYASVSRGVKASAFNTSPVIAVGADPRSLTADDEFVISYEVGAKTTWRDGRLGLNGAIFYLDYTDYQVLTNIPNGTLPDGSPLFVNIFDNAGELTSKGAELEIFAAPTETLRITGGLAYLDAKFDKFEGAFDIDLGIIDASGKENPVSPEWSINFAVDHELQLGDIGSLVTNLNYKYRDDYFVTATNHPFSAIPSLGLLGGRIGFRSADERWGIYLWGKNLTDENKPVFRFFDGVLNGEEYIQPRTFGLTVNYQL